MRKNADVPRLGSGIPFIGRADELVRLRTAFKRAEQGEPGAVLLAGDAGVGKTRLLAELSEFAGERGALVLSGRCLDMHEGGLPYLPFVEALSGLLDADGGAFAAAVRSRPALGRLLFQPELENPIGPKSLRNTEETTPAPAHYQVGEPGVDATRLAGVNQNLGQLQLFDAILGALTQVSEQQPTLLVVEDVHWADASTRNLLSFVLSRLRRQRLLVVASYREEDVHRTHPLRALLAELVRQSVVTQVELPPLTQRETVSFVESLIERPVSPDKVANVARRSEGNPFFAEELVAASADQRTLPAGLAELLLARLERLSADTKHILRVVAAAGDPVAHTILAEVADHNESQLDESLREAVQHHILVIENGEYVFRHALLQESVYDDLLPGERSRIHAKYAARLSKMSDGRGRDARLAYHSLKSKDFPIALAALIRAADEAEELGAPNAALRHIEQALDIWDAVSTSDRPDDVDELRLLSEASYFASSSGELERAKAYARSAVRALPADSEPERAARVYRQLTETLLVHDDTLDEATETIEHAWRLISTMGPSEVRAWVLATRARVLRSRDKPEEALWSAQTAVADARAVGAAGAEAFALIMLGVLADSAGQCGQARELLRQAEDIARNAGAVKVELRVVYYLALSYEDQAELSVAIDHYRRGIDRARETGLGLTEFGLEVQARHLFLRYVTGDWPDTSAPEHPRVGAPSAAAARIAASWVYLLVGRGQFAFADKLLQSLDEHRHNDILVLIAAGAASVELACWRGEYAEAVRISQESVDQLERFEPWQLAGLRIGALGVFAAAAWADNARRNGDEQTAAQAVAAGEGLIEHVRGCVAYGAPRTGTLGGEGQAWAIRAEAAASGLTGSAKPALWEQTVSAFGGYGAVYEEAVSRLCYAKALLREGDADRGDRANQAAEQLVLANATAEHLDARPLRDAIQDLARRARISLSADEAVSAQSGQVDPLTDRERSVLELVALGHTNRQVGDALYISDKTVSVHLSRVMAKLGATRRTDAVAIAYERGLLARSPQ